MLSHALEYHLHPLAPPPCISFQPSPQQTITICNTQNFGNVKYSTFHKTLPKSSLKMLWISIRLCKTGDMYKNILKRHFFRLLYNFLRLTTKLYLVYGFIFLLFSFLSASFWAWVFNCFSYTYKFSWSSFFIFSFHLIVVFIVFLFWFFLYILHRFNKDPSPTSPLINTWVN